METIKMMWAEFTFDFKSYLKIAVIILGLIALFVVAASAASPLFVAFDKLTGYGV